MIAAPVNASSLAPILYVEDEENDVLLLKIAFKQAKVDWPLAIAVDGREAVDYLFGSDRFADREKHPFPHLVLLDLNLPRLSGLEVLQEVRQQPQWTALPIIVFSSSDQQSDRDKAQALGATDYIVKPSGMHSFVEFAARLKQRWLPA